MTSARFSVAAAWTLLGLAFLSATGTGLLLDAAPSWSSAETRIVGAVNGFHAPVPDAVARGIDTLFGTPVALTITVVLAAVLGRISRSWTTALRTGALIALPWSLVYLVKLLVRRPRPAAADLPYASGIEPSSWSFPSGYTAVAAALMVTVVLLVPVGLRLAAIAIACVVILATAWSRVYLGVHYPTDVMTSMILVPAAVIALHRITGRRSSPPHPVPRRIHGPDQRWRPRSRP